MYRSRPHYRREGDHYLIELHLSDIEQLFNSLDPAPIHSKDLAPSVETYIVESARELPSQAALKLLLHLPPETVADESSLTSALHNYFTYQGEVATLRLRALLRRGRTTLLIGLSFLFSCIFAQQLLGSLLEEGLWRSAISEGFFILGWVAMWRPVETFLYDWWPIRNQQRLLARLAHTPVSVELRQQT